VNEERIRFIVATVGACASAFLFGVVLGRLILMVLWR
jgi:hypothetical protein